MIELYHNDLLDCEQHQEIIVQNQEFGSYVQVVVPEENESVEDANMRTMVKAAAESLFNMSFSTALFPFAAPLARDKVLDTFSKDSIYKLLNQYVKSYDNWQNYIVKRTSFAGYYASDQKIYGCLMAAFSHILADKIKKGLKFDQLVDLACYGRQLMCKISVGSKSQSMTVESEFLIAQYGSQRILLDTEEQTPTTLISNAEKCVYTEVGYELARLAQDWKLLNSPWIRVEDDCLIYIGQTDTQSLTLSIIKDINVPSAREVIHTRLQELSIGIKYAEKLFNESLSLQGEALNQKLGQFFWWWCQLKPVKLGDPSISEMLLKAVLISKGCNPPGWKQGIAPWEETLKKYDPIHFGEVFSSFWEI